MKKFTVLVMGLVSLGAMAGCEDDDRKSVRVPAAVQGAFGKMFPAASHVEWEDRGGYVVADFRSAGTVMQAWFDAAGKWHMTEEDISYAELPQAVRTAYEAGDYAAWHVDDVDKLQRNGQETVYVIEVEHAKQEFDLYYSEDGVLLREAADTDGNGDHGDMLPQELPKAVSDFIARKYPGARIIDAEREKGNTEVDIIFAGKALEVCFGTGDAWLWTKTELRLSEIPDVVRRALQSSQYGTWEIDDADLYESPPRMVRLRHGRPAIRTGGDGVYPRGRHPALIVPHICTEPASLGAGPVFFCYNIELYRYKII